MVSLIRQGLKVLIKQGAQPVQLILYVTSKCNLRCRHCYFWHQINKGEDLSLSEIEAISEGMSELPLLTISGGEPFLREDLPDILYAFYNNNQTRDVVIPTNGTIPGTIDLVKRIIALCPDMNLVIYISLDDIGEAHDKIRGVDGTFEKAIDTYKQLHALRETTKLLSIGTITTVSTLNQNSLKRIIQHMKTLEPNMIYLNLIRGKPKEDIKDIDISKYFEATQLIEKDLLDGTLRGNKTSSMSKISTAINILTHRKIYGMNSTDKKYLHPCYAGTLNAVIYPDGKLFPCEMLNEEITDLRKNGYDFKKAWGSSRAKEIRHTIKKLNCYCTHECFMNTNILFNMKYLPEILYNALQVED